MSMKVGLVLGRFQGFTLAHEQLIRWAFCENTRIFVYVITGSQNKENPFDFETRKTLIGSVFENMEVHQARTANLDLIADEISKLVSCKTIIPLTIYCGEDRMQAYETQLKYINGFDIGGVDKTKGKKDIFKASIKYIPRTQDGISATKIRQLLSEGNEEGFRLQAPQQTWIYYHKLKEILDASF
jgi:citrate lyase synthetase